MNWINTLWPYVGIPLALATWLAVGVLFAKLLFRKVPLDEEPEMERTKREFQAELDRMIADNSGWQQ